MEFSINKDGQIRIENEPAGLTDDGILDYDDLEQSNEAADLT